MTKQQLENKIAPFRLVHFFEGSDDRPAKYTASEDASGAAQRASTPEDLVRRCQGWVEQRNASRGSARVTAGLASVGPRDEPDPDKVAA